MIKLGKYRHFKGKEYEVIGIAKHSEELRDYVIYRKLYDDYSMWIRPLDMFCEEVDVDGVKMKRFEYIDE